MKQSTCTSSANGGGKKSAMGHRRSLVALAVSAAIAVQATAADHEAASRLAQASKNQGDASEGADDLEEVVVTGRQFNYNDLGGANKLPMSVKQTPQSVRVITGDMLDFASVQEFGDIYKLDAGMYTANGHDGFSWSYFRGFATGFAESFKVDGFRVIGRVKLDLAAYERIEIIKGSTSTLYGQASVAGTLNAISKMPQAEHGGSVSLGVGSYDHYRADVDTYGALTADDRLTYRFIGAYTDEGSFMDYVDNKHLLLAPSFKYELSPSSSVTLQLNYQDLKYTPLEGYPPQFKGGDDVPENYGFPDVPRSRYGGSTWAEASRKAKFANLILNHQLAGDWTLRANAQASDVRGPVKRNRLVGADETGLSDMYLYFDDFNDTAYSGEVNLFGDVELFGRKQTLFLGVDYAKLLFDDRFAAAYLTGADTGFNILTPDYSLIPNPTSYADFTPGGQFYGFGEYTEVQKTRSQRYGATAQALLRPTDKLLVLLGTRYSHSQDKRANALSTSFDDLSPYVDGQRTNAWTLQSGITYAIGKSVNAYATYGETFEPRQEFGYDPNDPTGPGIDLGPEEGVTYEAGFKGDLFDKRFAWSVDYFVTARKNVVQQDHAHPNYSAALGRQEGKGVELDFQGKITPGWDVYASFTSMKNEFTEGDLAGTPSPFEVKLGASIFSSYQLQNGPLRGLGFGGGVVYKQRPDYYVGQVAYPNILSDFTEVDLRAFYDDQGPWSYELAVTNLLDEKYYSPIFAQFFGCCVFVNPPRQFTASVKYEFGKR